MKTITVFTTTYNRIHLLNRLYTSLCSQTSKDFLWLIIDDGSSDNTDQLVNQWMVEKKIEIHYHYKKNGGMHTGHNAAYKMINTELNVCIDSDDYMPSDGIKNILEKWHKIADKSKIAGIIGLDAEANGKIIGTKIPDNLIKGSLRDLYRRHRVAGDKKIILRTDIIQNYPSYPEFENEKLVPLGLLYLMIGKDYDFLYSNEVFCIVEYQEEGSSSTIFRQYKQSPQGFAYSRKVKIKFGSSFKDKFKEHMHLISSSIFAKDFSLAFKDVNPLMSLLAFPFGILLHGYILAKIKS